MELVSRIHSMLKSRVVKMKELTVKAHLKWCALVTQPSTAAHSQCDVHPDDLELRDGGRILGKGASGVVKLMHHKATGQVSLQNAFK